MNKRTMDEMISYFNQEVSKMDISQENKMKLLGMITAIGYESKKQKVVHCRECKWLHIVNDNILYGFCTKGHAMFYPFQLDSREFYCADGERRDPCSSQDS